MKKVIALLILAIAIGGCASKRFVKKGLEMENAGLYTDAANQYYNSLVKNVNNIDAKLGLQRTGQLVLDDYIDLFKSKYQSGTPKEAVYAFVTAENYYKKLKGVGVNPIFPEEQRTYYKEVEDSYLADLYERATKALGAEEFNSAENLYNELLKFNTNYKDVPSKWKIAKYEPLYRKGNEFVKAEMFRSAYLTFKGIIDEIQSYENSLVLMNESLEKAKLTIAVASVDISNSSYKAIAPELRNQIINGINKINSPLYEVVLPSTVESTRHNYGLSPNKNKEEVYPSSVKAIINTRIQKVYLTEGKLIKEEKKGYLKREVEYVDKETNEKKKKNVYDKIKYYEYKKENKADVSIQYTMKRRDSGEVVFSELFTKQGVDRIHYCSYDGDYKKVIPGNWKYQNKDSEDDYYNEDASHVNELQALFKNDAAIQSSAELKDILVNEMVEGLVSKVKDYQPEK